MKDMEKSFDYLKDLHLVTPDGKKQIIIKDYHLARPGHLILKGTTKSLIGAR